MKLFLNLFTTFVAISAQSDITVPELGSAKTIFWQALYEINQSAKIITTDAKLAKVCQEYKNLMLSQKLAAEEISLLRSETESISSSQFSSYFKIVTGSAPVQDHPSSDLPKLPFYNQVLAELNSSYLPLGKVNLRIVSTGTPSLVQISNSAGLKVLPVQISGDSKNPLIKVFGKDSACDLLDGHVQLTFDSQATLKISLESQRQISDFYSHVKDITKDILAKKKSNSSRATLFGFRLAAIMPSSNSEMGSFWVSNIVETFFDENLMPNNQWTLFNGEKYLTVNGAVNAPIKIILEK